MKKASHKLMDYLAIRDHSVKELQKKLGKNYSTDEINEALEHAQQSGWLLDPTVLSGKVARQLGAKLKGILYINKYLREKGLPEVAADNETELEKVNVLLEKQTKAQRPYSHSDRIMLHRYLANRGFTREVIGKALHEKP